MFEEVGEAARPTRANTIITDGGQVKREKVLKVGSAKLEVRKNFFNIWAARSWNEIPDEVKMKTSVNAFKNAYDAWDNSSSDTVQ